MEPSKARILLAEDEAPLRNLVRMSLESIGHQVTAVSDGEEALATFRDGQFDLVVLDVMMPRIDGFTVCEEIRKDSDIPIIMLTALGSTDDLVKGFELGADDYITKPFTFKEVQARVHAILRRAQWTVEKKTPVLLTNGRISIDTDAQEVRVDAAPMHVSPIEFRLLFTLMANAGKAMTRSELFEVVWGYDFIGGTNLVEVAVRRLREKIESDPSRPTYLLTVRGTGYKFRNPDEGRP